ncbi:cupin domain-containing protein [Acidithiobacillus sp.]|uniref:cupin domain-containing protein n=1 Tax=Acidithiobacillus sp. TaxID=1872118 RepID=UPI002633FA2C|nr:cupin domain-containing protein [Acidithiobacillus sp.]
MDTRKLLLTAQEIDQMKGEHKVHYLNPGAVRINKSLGDAVGLRHMGIHLIQIEPGKESTEYHRHHYEEEAVYVLSGKGMLTMEGDQYPIAPGDFVGFPCHTVAHSIINDGTETLEYLAIGQRLDQDVADYPNQHKRLYRNNGEWNLVDMADIRVLREPTQK